jgi:hypothetical protein
MDNSTLRRCRIVAMIGSLSLAVALTPTAVLAAAGTPIGSPFEIGSNAFLLGVARAPDGHFAVLWSVNDAVTNTSTPHVQAFDASGTPVAPDITLGPVGAGAVNPHYTEIVADGNGNFDLLEQEQPSSTALGPSLNVVRLGADGALLGTPIAVTSFTVTGNRHLYLQRTLAASASGDFVVAWRYNLSTPFGNGAAPFTTTTNAAYARTYRADGSPVAGPFPVLAPSKSSSKGPSLVPQDLSVAMSGSGDVVLAWSSIKHSLFFPTLAYSSNGIYAQIFGEDGTPKDSAFRVSDTSQTSPINNNYGFLPAVAADTAGNFVVAWNYYSKTGSTFDGYAQRYDAAGDAMGPRIALPENANGTAPVTSRVAFDSAGHFLISASAVVLPDLTPELTAQFYNTADGSTVGGPLVLINGYSGACAIDGAGEPLAAWTYAESPGPGLPVVDHTLAQLYTGP